MFGLGDNNQTQGDDPAMLDNVKQLVSEPADKVEPQDQTQSMQSFSPTAIASTDDPTTTPQSTQAFTATSTKAADDQNSTNDDLIVDVSTDTDSTEPNSDFHEAKPAFDFTETQTVPTPPMDPQALAEDVNPEVTPHLGSMSSAVLDERESPKEDYEPTSADTEKIDIDTSPEVTADSNPLTTQMEQSNPVDKEHLAGMKQTALEHLEPLVGHLDQSPEETFKTTMMMIQANDNHTLIEKALDAAKEIADDKARAQAMLDIINEINYFSQS